MLPRWHKIKLSGCIVIVSSSSGRLGWVHAVCTQMAWNDALRGGPALSSVSTSSCSCSCHASIFTCPFVKLPDCNVDSITLKSDSHPTPSDRKQSMLDCVIYQVHSPVLSSEFSNRHQTRSGPAAAPASPEWGRWSLLPAPPPAAAPRLSAWLSSWQRMRMTTNFPDRHHSNQWLLLLLHSARPSAWPAGPAPGLQGAPMSIGDLLPDPRHSVGTALPVSERWGWSCLLCFLLFPLLGSSGQVKPGPGCWSLRGSHWLARWCCAVREKGGVRWAGQWDFSREAMNEPLLVFCFLVYCLICQNSEVSAAFPTRRSCLFPPEKGTECKNKWSGCKYQEQ